MALLTPLAPADAGGVSPAPDSVIRVLIDFRALDAPVKLKPQVLTPVLPPVPP